MSRTFLIKSLQHLLSKILSAIVYGLIEISANTIFIGTRIVPYVFTYIRAFWALSPFPLKWLQRLRKIMNANSLD